LLGCPLGVAPVGRSRRSAALVVRPRLAGLLGFVPAAVIFDMDGVLADSEPINEQATAAVLARRGATLPRETYQALAGQASDRSWAWLIERFGLSEGVPQLEREYVAELLPRLAGGLRPTRGARELIGALTGAGIPLAVASSSPRVVVETVLGGLGLRGAFAVVVTGDEVRAGKPAPDIFQRAAAQLGVAPAACLVIEDSPHGLAGARAAGMRTIGVATRYLPRDALRADLVVDSLEGLARGLTGH
jgi:HAD superfamily hydrolase (TIGR01509 family)